MVVWTVIYAWYSILVSAATVGLGCDCCRDSDGRPLLRTGSYTSGASPSQSFDEFLGVRYAEPMANASARWRHATPKRLWSGVVDALQYGPSCPSQRQPPGLAPSYADRGFSEDCAFLNIWSPDVHAKRPLPVVLWVHGGSFIAGSGAQTLFNGSNIARSVRNLVFVSINCGSMDLPLLLLFI